jgi:hypothetical protein
MTHTEIMKRKWNSLADLKDKLNSEQVEKFDGASLFTVDGTYRLYDNCLVFDPKIETNKKVG